ncbi:hypothetical protein CUMW_108090 [Citrus unshiu]|uniref:Uncharacterized protein n=1 Tax=Citrus unshiu TaxID=55188 RepID=A0A2H5P6E2_CITUN|nr:hypothetical protein CUMW_108090 [Citrus unshiu]
MFEAFSTAEKIGIKHFKLKTQLLVEAKATYDLGYSPGKVILQSIEASTSGYWIYGVGGSTVGDCYCFLHNSDNKDLSTPNFNSNYIGKSGSVGAGR